MNRIFGLILICLSAANAWADSTLMDRYEGLEKDILSQYGITAKCSDKFFVGQTNSQAVRLCLSAMENAKRALGILASKQSPKLHYFRAISFIYSDPVPLMKDVYSGTLHVDGSLALSPRASFKEMVEQMQNLKNDWRLIDSKESSLRQSLDINVTCDTSLTIAARGQLRFEDCLAGLEKLGSDLSKDLEFGEWLKSKSGIREIILGEHLSIGLFERPASIVVSNGAAKGTVFLNLGTSAEQMKAALYEVSKQIR